MFNKRVLMRGGLSTALSAVFIAIVIVLNAVAVWAVEVYPIKIDMTRAGLFKIEANVLELLNSMEKEVIIYLPKTENQMTVNKKGADILVDTSLKNMVMQSNGMLSIEYVDAKVYPDFFTEYLQKQVMDRTMLFVVCEDNIKDNIDDNIEDGSNAEDSVQKRFKVVDVRELFSWRADAYGFESVIDGYKAEQVIASSIKFVTSDDLPPVGFVKGHGEYDALRLKNVFTSNNYLVKNVDLSISSDEIGIGIDVDDKMFALVIVNPEVDFSDDEIKKISDYVYYGGNLMVFLSSTVGSLPKLESYLMTCGIEVINESVYDLSYFVENNIRMVVPTIVQSTGTYKNPYIGTSLTNDTKLIVPFSKPLKPMFAVKGSRYVFEILKSSNSAYANPITESGSAADPAEAGENKVFDLALSYYEERYENNVRYESKVLVCGGMMAEDSLLNAANYANNTFIANAIAYFRGNVKDDTIIVPKPMETNTLKMDANTFWIISSVLVGGIPLTILFIGMVVYLRRRHR